MKLSTTHWIIIIIIIVVVIILVVWHINNNGKDKKSVTTLIKTPKNLSIESGDGVLNVKWDKVEDADFYTFYFSEDSSFKPEKTKKMGPIPKTKMHISKISMGNYWVKVTATKMVKDGKFKKKPLESSATKIQAVGVTLCSPPDTPSDVKLIKREKDVEVSWNPSHSAEGYSIYINNDSSNKGKSKVHAIINLKGHIVSHILKDLPENIEWYVGVKALANHSGASQMSEEVSIKL